MATEVASAYVSLSANTAALTTGLAQAEAKVRGFAAGADAAAGRASKSFAAMGVAIKRGLLVGGLAAAAGLTSAVKTAADFETELSALRSVTRASAGDMDRLKEAALDLGAETKFSALEVAQAQTELARAGMSTADILGGSLRGSLALAAAGQMELADASATIVNTMGQFGLSVADATHIADALAEAANATTADVGEMAQALENVGNIARNAGLSFDDVVVGLELLAENGTKGAEAGSALRSMLTNIATPSAKAAKLMNELGLEFYDAQGNFKDFGEVSSMLQRSFAGLTAEQKQNAAAVIAGTYGQKALLAILQASPQAIAQYERGLQRQGQAAEMAATMNDNLQGKFEQLGGAIETIKIRVGSALIPILSEAAVATAEWLDAIGSSSDLESFADAIATGFARVGSAASALWGAVGPLFDQIRGISISAFSALSGAAEGAYPVLLALANAAGGLVSAALAVIGPVMSMVDSIANIPGVAQAATSAVVGLGAAFVTFRGINAAIGMKDAVAGMASFVAALRAARPAADAAASATARITEMQRIQRAQAIATATASVKADAIAASSRAAYLSTFTRDAAKAAAAHSAFTRQVSRLDVVAAAASSAASRDAAASASRAAAVYEAAAAKRRMIDRADMAASYLRARTWAEAAARRQAADRAEVLSAQSRAKYLSMFTRQTATVTANADAVYAAAAAKRQATMARMVTTNSALAKSELRTAAISAASARTYASTFAPSVAKAAAPVSRLSMVMGSLQRTFPMTSAAIGALASPVGIAALAVGGLTAATVALASGMFSGASAAQQLANALKPVTEAANNAAGAITNLKSATGSLKDAHLAEKGALLAHEAAQKRVNELKAQGKKGTLEYRQALQSEAEAARNVDKARQASARAQAQVNKQAIAGVVDLARLATAEDRATADIGTRIKAIDRLKRSLNVSIPPQYIKAWKDLERQGGTTNQRFSLMRKTLEGTAKELRKIGDVKGAEKLERLAKLDMAGWKNFASEVQTGMREGLTQVQAVEKAMKNLKPPRDMRLNVRAEPARRAIQDVDRAIGRLPRDKSTSLRSDPTNALLGVSSVNAALATIPSEKVVNVRVVGHWPTGSPRVYEIPDLLDSIRSKTVDVTVRPHGSGELEAMERRVARISSGNVQGLRRQYGGGSLDLLRDALSGAGSLLIRADLDIANLPEVLAEARQAGVSIGGGFAAGIEKDRKALARLVAQSNALISRIENLRSLTDQLARAQSRARGAKGDEKKQAQAEVSRIRKQIEAAMKAYRQIAGNRSAPDAIADLNRRITAQIRKLNKPARELRDKAEEFRQAKEDFVEAFKSAALDQFDRETTAQLNGIAASFQNGFERIGNTFRLIPGELRKLDDRTEAAMDALQATLDSQLKGIDAKYKAAGKALDARARELTAAEKRLAQIRDEQSASDIARNVQEAEAALREAYAKGMPASEIKQRQRAVEEARRAELIAGLEKTAEAERAAKDAQVEAERERLAELEAAERESAQRRFETAQKRLQDTAEAERLYLEAMLAERQESLELQRNAERVALEQSLNAWGNAFMRQQAIVGGNHASVLAQVKSFSDKLRTSGSRLGQSYAQGLRESFPAIRRAASDAADIISRYLKLHSPAKEGPLSDLDRWWGPFGRTLVSGADMGMADALVRAYSNPELGGAAGPVGMSGPVVVNVTVVDQTFAGMSRDQARRVAQDIKPELDRIVSVGVR